MTGSEFHAQVRAALDRLDGSTVSAVALLTGATPTELDALGGVTEPVRPTATVDTQPRTVRPAPPAHPERSEAI